MAHSGRRIDILLIGDCVFLDILAFLLAPTLDEGISIETVFITSKNPAERHKNLAELRGRRFDLAFYSPYTYEFQIEYSSLNQSSRSFLSISKIERLANSAAEQTETDLNLLCSLFECPIFVHNSANVRRHDGGILELMKGVFTRYARRRARSITNGRLKAFIAARNSATFSHLFLLDEEPLLEQYGEFELGRKLYNSDLQHPAVMGKHLAEIYSDIIFVHAYLFNRKLVVCDLDNTLWKGEIGEGVVEHLLERQQTLKHLRQKGVVLAVNSKNDPKNVSWQGASLTDDDFVCQQINWDHKVVNMKRIQDTLNLKFKDYVFLDDRADQLALVADSIPEILCMDATCERTWRRIRLWKDMLTEQDGLDRTEQYREKKRREEFLATLTPEIDQDAMFNKLGLCITIREARRSDYKRIVELINRTNQFNLAGSRTTYREIEEWGKSVKSKIFVAEGSDKFGAMGLVCVVVVQRAGTSLQIPVFVLSCRVFGYEFETAVLTTIISAAKAPKPDGLVEILGVFRETPHNAPCRAMYPRHGFRWDGTTWRLEIEKYTEIKIPNWLKITNECRPS